MGIGPGAPEAAWQQLHGSSRAWLLMFSCWRDGIHVSSAGLLLRDISVAYSCTADKCAQVGCG